MLDPIRLPTKDARESKTNPAGGGRRRWLFRLIVFCGSLALALIIGEIAVRLCRAPGTAALWVEEAPYGIRRMIAHVRGTIITSEYRHKVSSNSEGFRGTREYAVAKPAGVFRIVALGDSVVNGYGVEDEQTFCALLEKKLSVTRPAEVLNLGIAGFASAEELIQLQHVGLRYAPDLVILGYFINDHYENLTSELFFLKDGKLVRNPNPRDAVHRLRDRVSEIPGYTFLAQHSRLVSLLRSRISVRFHRRLAAKHNVPDYFGEKLSPDQIALTAALVDEIINTCSRRGIPVLVLNIPMRRNGAWFRNLPVEQLKFRDHARIVDVAEQIFKVRGLEELAHKISYHPKPLGHQLIADWLADYVQQQLWGIGSTGGQMDQGAVSALSLELGTWAILPHSNAR